MKGKRLVFALVVLAISFALPTYAQNDVAELEITQKILATLNAFDEAHRNNDALAALFTRDAVFVTPEGPMIGREAIQKWYTDQYQRWHPQTTSGTVRNSGGGSKTPASTLTNAKATTPPRQIPTSPPPTRIVMASPHIKAARCHFLAPSVLRMAKERLLSPKLRKRASPVAPATKTTAKLSSSSVKPLRSMADKLELIWRSAEAISVKVNTAQSAGLFAFRMKETTKIASL